MKLCALILFALHAHRNTATPRTKSGDTLRPSFGSNTTRIDCCGGV